MVFLCLFVAFFCTVCVSEASFESQCVVKGSEVDFYCPNEKSWRFNSIEVFNDVTGVLNFTLSNETGRQDYLTVVADTAYVDKYSDTSLIHCSQRYNGGNLYAMLIIADESQPHQQFFPMLSPLSWTSVSLMWSPPVCCCCYSYDYVDYTYTVTLSTESGTNMTETVVPHTGNGTVEVELVLGGHECDEFQVEISLPGNCPPSTISGSLLLDPVYPKPQGLKAILQNTTSVALTWTHPDTSQLMLVDSEELLVYSIRGNVAATGATVLQYTTVFSVNDRPMEVVDLSGRQCQDILFSISLEWDCRELSTAVVLPVFPAEFSSEEITVTHFFSANLHLNKIEVSFEAPALCPSQEANYTLVFTEAVSGRSRQVASGSLTGRPGELVRIDITEVDWLKLEENYSVSVTISTVLGNVSSTTKFALSTAALNPIREHPHSVVTTKGTWANFSCGIKLPGFIKWRIGDFTNDGHLYNSAGNLPGLEGVTAELSFAPDITGKILTETIGVLATPDMDGVPVECMYKHPTVATRDSYSKFALIEVHPAHTSSGDHDC